MFERWYWLDWLRVLAMGTVFLYHSGMPFVTYDTWHVMNSQPDLMITLFNLMIVGWVMPLFFVISGLGTFFTLAKRSPLRFSKDRFKRLIISFLLPGLLVVLPFHVYYDKMFHGTFVGDFTSFYLGPYFTKFFPFDTDFSATYFADSNQGVYLWYIFWLFVFSIVAVHFFKWIMKGGNRSRVSRLAAVCNRRGGIFLLAIPIILVNIVAVPPFFVFPTGYGGGKLPTYLAFFVVGYVLASDPQFGQSAEKNRRITLPLGIVANVFMIIVLAIFGEEALAAPLWPNYIAVSILWPLMGWCWVSGIIGYGRKLLSFNHRFLEISNELVLPFYILHQTVTVTIAFYGVSWNLIVIGKYLIIALASFAAICVLLYPIRQINVLRSLFGMRLKKV
jgi:glucan biosynthesis protein C